MGMFKTLLVEDNLAYRSALKNALLKRYVGLEAREASGESDALECMVTYSPDLIIMDIDLSSAVNGLDLTKEIKSKCPEVVVVILSQHDNPEYRSAAQQNGADHYFSKLSSLESIFDYVDSVVISKRGLH